MRIFLILSVFDVFSLKNTYVQLLEMREEELTPERNVQQCQVTTIELTSLG